MTLEEIVDIYGSSLNRHLVSRREEIKIGGAFKGVKTYIIELWDVKDHKITVTGTRNTVITAENRESVISEIEREFVKAMFEYYASERKTE